MKIDVRVAGAFVAALLASGAASAATPASTAPTQPQTSVSFVSEPGDFVGGGTSKTFVSPVSTISVSGDQRTIRVSVYDSTSDAFYEADFAAGVGDTLHPGRYAGAERYPFQTGRSPGVSFSGDGRGCNQDFGGFTVNQIAFDSSGAVTMADVSFIQHCESKSAPALRGTVRFNALPLSYTQASQRGDYIGGGVTKTYYNGSSVFSLSGSPASVDFSVSGLGDDWDGTLAAPEGQELVAGKTYQANRFGDATHAGLDVFGNGRGCNETTGTLTIRKITSVDGVVTRLSATFVQHCGASVPALTGTLHYFD